MGIVLALSVLAAAPDGGVLLARNLKITAKHFAFDNKLSRGQYREDVKAVRDDGLTLTCDELESYLVDGRIRRVVARGNVYAIDGDREAWGDEAEFDNENGVLTVRGKPRGKQGPREVEGELVTFTTGVDKLVVHKARTRVKEPKDQRVNIDADLLTLEGPKNEARWTGHVRAVKGKTLLVAPELLAHHGADGEIDRVKARGGVEVTEGDRWARGQAGDYDVARGLLVVTGQPQARDKTMQMRGTKVFFYTGRDLLEVENVSSVIEIEKKKVP